MKYVSKGPEYTENLLKELEKKRVEYREKILRDRADKAEVEQQVSDSEARDTRLDIDSLKTAKKRKRATEDSDFPNRTEFLNEDHVELREPRSIPQEVAQEAELQRQQPKSSKSHSNKVANSFDSLSISQKIHRAREQSLLQDVTLASSRSSSVASQKVPLGSQDGDFSQQSTGLFVSERNPAAREERLRLEQQPQPIKQEPISQANLHVEVPEPSAEIVSNRGSAETEDSASRAVFGPAKKAAKKTTTVYRENKQVDTRVLGKSEWYINIKPDKKYSRGDVISMQRITTLVQNCVKAAEEGEDSSEHIPQVRNQLQRMEFFPFITPTIIKQSRVLDQNGLPAIFNNEGIFPWDVVADAEALYTRWMSGDIDPHLLRGIDTSKGVLENGSKRTSHRINAVEKARYGKSANVSGDNGLKIGQWWPSRLCALRDGAHGEQEAGIHGKPGQGTFSVVIAKSDYVDNDNGENLTYCGTASSTSSPTRSTQLMRETLTKTRNPIRVLRAANKKNKYAPEFGVRYDGLYSIVSEELLDQATAMYRFSMIRQPGQLPIRYQGDEVRPSSAEKQELLKIRHLLKGLN